MCESKGCQHKKESPIKDWKHRCKYGPDGKKLKKGTLIKGWNDLATTHDELVKECLDDTTDVTGSSSKSKKWKCKVCGHEWSGIVRNRTNGHGCKPCGDKASAKKRRTFPYEKSVAFFYPHHGQRKFVIGQMAGAVNRVGARLGRKNIAQFHMRKA